MLKVTIGSRVPYTSIQDIKEVHDKVRKLNLPTYINKINYFSDWFLVDVVTDRGEHGYIFIPN